VCQCSWCRCNHEDHDEYRICPIFNNEKVCDICCDWEMVQKDSPEKIKQATGKDMTIPEIVEMCLECNKHNGILRIKLS
jgi:hypothetical protein